MLGQDSGNRSTDQQFVNYRSARFDSIEQNTNNTGSGDTVILHPSPIPDMNTPNQRPTDLPRLSIRDSSRWNSDTVESLRPTMPAIPPRLRQPSFTPVPPTPTVPRPVPELSGAQSGANMEAMFRQMAEMFANTFKQTINSASNLPDNTVRHIAIPTFAGLDHEDPESFMAQLDEYFVRARIEDDRDKLQVVAEQLKGYAKKWYEPYQNIMPSFRTFTERFLEQFNSTARVTRIMTSLYGTKQTKDEPVGVFIIKKMNLFQRMDPNKTETLQINVILDQLLPEIRSRLRGQTIRTLDALASIASQIEADLGELDTKHIYRTTRPPTTQSNTAGVNRHIVTDRTSAVPPSPCRYCPEEQWHFHRDCPNNQQRYTPGNAEGARGGFNRAPPQFGPTTTAATTNNPASSARAVNQ